MKIKLSQWAKLNGIGYKTAWRWHNEGILPVKSIKLSTGTILVDDNPIINSEDNVIIYCRVSNHNRKKELEYQVKRCEEFCLKNGWSINKIYKEIASGLNDTRKEFWKMIKAKPTKIIIENKDRLTRFGFNYLKEFLKEKNCEIIIINNDNENEADLIKDLCSIIYSFCAKLYGLRRAANKAAKIKASLFNENY